MRGSAETVVELREALAGRDRLLRGLSAASQALLRLRGDDMTGMAGVLGLLGGAAGVQRVYIFENDRDPQTGAPQMSQRCEWTLGAVESFIDDPKLQHLPYAQFEGWYASLSARRPVQQWTRVLTGLAREIMDEQGILVLLLVPIFVDEAFWGFIGFDNCTSERPWSEAEVEVLRAFADTLGAALVRHRIERRLAGLATPVLRIFDRTLVLPLHGLLYASRIAAIARDALRAIADVQALEVLIDLTGVPELSAPAADGLARLAGAARLIGARSTVVGLAPAVAADLVGHTGALADLRACATLEDGLLRALAARGLRVAPAGR
jgi:GAF domain-containing protein